MPRIKLFSVIGLISPYAINNESRCSTYNNGKKIRELSLPQFLIKDTNRLGNKLLLISFFYYVISIVKSLIFMRKRYDLFIGCATFSTAMGILLRKLGIVKKVVYYCLDYYPTPNNRKFEYFFNYFYKWVDNYCINNSDVVWDISPRIKDARRVFSNLNVQDYRPIIVPMGWGTRVNRNVPIVERDRWAIGFIGTLSPNQGLQMVINCFPKLILKYPNLKLHIIGHGPYYSTLMSLVRKFNIEKSIFMHGYISEDEKAFDILQNCMIGLAPWTGDDTDNSYYADPGKPKLYALLGLPILLTNYTMVSTTISNLKAGVAISYSEDEFINAIDLMLGEVSRHERFMLGLDNFKKICDADTIFEDAFEKTFLILENSYNA
jgi:glycosyltransferase involved in cell wall biosynthesis